jgi:UDP-N-acetylglucosamine--N-acetylmuramyl-(pentapeptide) pyrophosphoryl-undecaprenol N-acetylglucosamine transferase
MSGSIDRPLVAIACGGTGGHLFPGMAIGKGLVRRGCEVTLLVSPKEVDQSAVRGMNDMGVETLPAVALQGRNYLRFLSGLRKSVRAARRLFRERRPAAVLSMGGFTAAAPVMAGKLFRAKLFLHESNAIPGRANRLLAPWVQRAFLGFRQAADHLKTRRITISGTPVREQFQQVVTETCRRVVRLDKRRPTLLVMGGSQGARAVNDLMMMTLPLLNKVMPELQYLWLAGGQDVERVRAHCEEGNYPVQVRKFLPEMEVAYGAATLAVARAGAASLAELAAMRVPSILVPLPSSADNHQYHNARNFEKTGAARMFQQSSATPEKLIDLVTTLVRDGSARDSMRDALEQWHRRDAADLICERILTALGRTDGVDEQEASGSGVRYPGEPMRFAAS